MNVDGIPNVRTCTLPVREGMRVKRQNAWPSLEHDIFSAIEKIDRFLPVGFYYKTFIHAPIEWHRVEGIIRKIAGTGSIKDELAKWRTGRHSQAHSEFEHKHLTTDITVVGGGAAGMIAALEASTLGARVLLIDDQPELGGHLSYSNDPLEIDEATGEADLAGLKAPDAATKLISAIAKKSNVTVLRNATVFGVYESNLLGVVQGKTMLKVRTNQLIIATGAQEYPALFSNNDLPGIFLSRGLQRLTNLYGVEPGKEVAVASKNGNGLAVARTLLESGTGIAAYADTAEIAETQEIRRLKASGVPVLPRHMVTEARGGKRVRSVVFTQLSDDGKAVPGTEQEVRCDTVAVAYGFETEAWLLTQAGCRTAYDEGLQEFVPAELKPAIHACGDITGLHDINLTIQQAKVAGLVAALEVIGPGEKSTAVAVDHARTRLESYKVGLAAGDRSYREARTMPHSPPYPASLRKAFVCVCEDVTAREVKQAIAEGFSDIETLKRYSTVTMGPCQGKMCAMTSLQVCARETGRTVPQTGRTVSRPPYLPVPMGALAGPELHPVKLTPMHYKHLEAGASLMDMGEWKRPYLYSSVEEEYKAVRENVGIIDVGTLGRLDLRGKDAPKLLDFAYTHLFSNLKVGKSRYGVICDDAGVILDDGTVTRLAEDHYFITTTTGNVDFVEQWLLWWATVFNLDAHITNVTAGLAAVNVAGPKARDLLKKLTTIDLSTQAFPYMNGAEGLVAGMPCILLRIGFVGETGWEIHLPGEYGEHFWNALMEAGKEFGIRPFGVETQRVLRLEKKHVIVGQDTDALSSPYEADMAWIVKFEKPDFVGRAALQAIQQQPLARKLIGFVMADAMVAHDGDQVYTADGRAPIGFVTSARFSGHLGHCVGMALVPPSYFQEGATVKIKVDAVLHEAKVMLAPFYDPEGKRLRA
jgi:sarcosine oxidase subunit alpha